MAILNPQDRTVRLSFYNSANIYSPNSFDGIAKQLSASREAVQTMTKILPIAPIVSVTSTLYPKGIDYIELKSVESISFKFSADIAVEPGLRVAFIQPWYIKPVDITIRGNSYIGAFPFVSNPDNDIGDIFYRLDRGLKEIPTGSEVASNLYNDIIKSDDSIFLRMPIRLEITNNPNNTKRFRGFIKDFSFSENLSKAFLLDYTIEFVGKYEMDNSRQNGKNDAENTKIQENPSQVQKDKKLMEMHELYEISISRGEA